MRPGRRADPQPAVAAQSSIAYPARRRCASRAALRGLCESKEQKHTATPTPPLWRGTAHAALLPTDILFYKAHMPVTATCHTPQGAATTTPWQRWRLTWLPFVSGPALAIDRMPAPVCFSSRVTTEVEPPSEGKTCQHYLQPSGWW